MSWLFGYVKNGLIRKITLINFKTYDVTNWNKQFQYTDYPISQEVEAITQWNLVSSWNITWETLFLKDHIQNVVE